MPVPRRPTHSLTTTDKTAPRPVPSTTDPSNTSHRLSSVPMTATRTTHASDRIRSDRSTSDRNHPDRNRENLHSPSTMAWALYLSNTSAASVTDAQLAELDDFELAARAGHVTRTRHLASRAGHILHALVCATGAINSRAQMLRSVSLLHFILTSADAPLIRSAIRDLVSAYLSDHRTPPSTAFAPFDPPFLQPLVSVAVNRVSDTQLSALAAHALAIILGHPLFDPHADNSIPPHIAQQADIQTRRLIAVLITEIVLTSSSTALAALSHLLRRDAARAAFCHKDGVSTLAEILQTERGNMHTAIGESIVSSNAYVRSDPVYAAYYAVFCVWMLSFSANRAVADLVLEKVISARLVVVLARLLDHASGQRLKVARVTLAALRNLAVGNDTPAQARVRRDLLAASVPATLTRLQTMARVRGSLMGSDADAAVDAAAITEALERERACMSTVDAYVAEVRADAMHDSPVHDNALFWAEHADRLVLEFPDVVAALAATVCDKQAADDKRALACSDLARLAGASAAARRAVARMPDLKASLMRLMAESKHAKLRSAALLCTQHLLFHRSIRVA